ncbi:hypothetical protein E2562_032679 [Oryza meyeriana var. granulata]|uniref:HMA domain-containing protein n=1 Tax=Oryza meyeriana var. granulata TaxID=110450 RepID=A0A6G1FF14_9ORYZ|nr:hypothetical protein E2562_032679 [Oryza meyeriana var. granulata]
MVLKVAMHCSCDGCKDKIRNAIKELALVPGVEAVDKSAVESKGEVRVVATAEPDKLRHRLHRATGKKVDLAVIRQSKPAAEAADGNKADEVATAVAAAMQSQAGAWGNGGWNAAGGGSHGATAVAYPPWGVQVQPEGGYFYSSSYPAGGWGSSYAAAAAYHQQLGHGGYGGAVSPWYTRG